MNTHRLTNSLLAGGTLLLLALAGGCTSAREVSVDAMAQPTFPSRQPVSYVIRTKPHPGQPASELRDAEAAQHVRTALSAQGMYEAPSAEQADIVVEVDYGIDPARVRFDTYRMPLYGRPRPSTEIRQVRTANAPEVEGSGSMIGTGSLGDYELVTVPVTIREKHLTVSGRENKGASEGKPAPEVFRVTAFIEDESPDLRANLPVLASAVMSQLGQQTEGTATVRADAAAVKFIQRGM